MSEGGVGMYPQPGHRSRWSAALGEWIEEDAPRQAGFPIMTDNPTDQSVKVTQDDITLAESVVTVANIVSHDGYYELDIDAVARTLARHRQHAAGSVREALEGLMEAAGRLNVAADGADNLADERKAVLAAMQQGLAALASAPVAQEPTREREAEIIERCAKVAEAAEARHEATYNDARKRGDEEAMDRCGARTAASRDIAAAIRALSSTESRERSRDDMEVGSE